MCDAIVAKYSTVNSPRPKRIHSGARQYFTSGYLVSVTIHIPNPLAKATSGSYLVPDGLLDKLLPYETLLGMGYL
nr:hypothetical protein MACL_00001058 [Theileria orientalis]